MECLKCGKVFESKVSHQKFCSITCKSSYYGTRHKYEVECQFCHKKFQPHRRGQKFCGRWCSVRGRSGSTARRSELNAQCASCGKQIYVVPKRLKNQFNYCNSQCMGDHRRVILNGSDNPNFKNIPNKKCVGCGKEFKSYSSSRRYCSNMCAKGAASNEALANLRRGLEAEKWCCEELVKAGFQAFRSAASKGQYDVIGISTDLILLIQVKRTKSRQPARIFPKKAIESLIASKSPINGNVSKEIWCWVDNIGWKKREV